MIDSYGGNIIPLVYDLVLLKAVVSVVVMDDVLADGKVDLMVWKDEKKAVLMAVM